MTTWPTLTKSPAVEGLIDLHVSPLDTSDFYKIKQSHEKVSADFPFVEEKTQWVGNLVLQRDAPATLSTTANDPFAIVAQSADRKTVVQFRKNGCAISRLHPYTNWAELRSRAESIWSNYSKSVKPDRILRTAVRFINRIPVLPGARFEDTFRTNFVISPALPQEVGGFLLRVVMLFEKEQSAAIVTQTMDEDGIHCIFDIDAFCAREGGFSEEEAWAQVDQLREIKNRVFFESLTKQTVESLL